MKDRILQTLRDLRAYALEQNAVVTLFYHEEDSYLMRFANSAVSLNTNEHLIRLEITAYDGRKRASFELITNLDQVDEMKRGIDQAVEMAHHAQALTYEPTIPVFTASFADDSAYDAALAEISSEERVAYFNRVAEGLETDTVRLSGIFSNGTNVIAQINTRSEFTQYFKSSDAQVTVVLSDVIEKWEVNAEQSAYSKAELDPGGLHRDLALLVGHYQNDQPVQMPPGKIDVIFGPAATADLLNYFNWIGINGGSMKRGFSFLSENDVCQKVFSEQFTLLDDPSQPDTFPFPRDFTGIPREPHSLFENGVFQGFVWSQDDADEYGAKASGHTVTHKSLMLRGGERDVPTLEALLNMPRERDVLYVPFLHYMGIVNPSKGIITGSSRFGALLLKADGSVQLPYNIRLTHSMFELFGDQVEWLSRQTLPYNESNSYGARNPVAIIVPRFMRVNGLSVAHSNTSF